VHGRPAGPHAAGDAVRPYDAPVSGDQHGRTMRGDHDRRRRPSDGFRVASGRRFSQLVEDALSTLPERLLDPVADAEIIVVDVPPEISEPGSALTDAEGVPLARFVPGAPGRLVVYRRPLEMRALNRGDLGEVLRTALGLEVARVLGIDDSLDDLFDDEDE